MFDRPRLNKLVAWRLLGSVEPNAGNAPPALTPAPGGPDPSNPPGRLAQPNAIDATKPWRAPLPGRRNAQPTAKGGPCSRRCLPGGRAGEELRRPSPVTPISDGLPARKVRYGFMERREHSGGAGGGGGEAFGAALDRDEAHPRRSPVGRFLPFVAPHLAPHR